MFIHQVDDQVTGPLPGPRAFEATRIPASNVARLRDTRSRRGIRFQRGLAEGRRTFADDDRDRGEPPRARRPGPSSTGLRSGPRRRSAGKRRRAATLRRHGPMKAVTWKVGAPLVDVRVSTGWKGATEGLERRAPRRNRAICRVRGQHVGGQARLRRGFRGDPLEESSVATGRAVESSPGRRRTSRRAHRPPRSGTFRPDSSECFATQFRCAKHVQGDREGAPRPRNSRRDRVLLAREASSVIARDQS